MILFFIVLAVAMLAALSLGLVGLSTIEYRTAGQSGHSAQLVQIVQSGIAVAALAIDSGEKPDIIDNPQLFGNIEVVPAFFMPSGFGSGRCSIFSPNIEQDQLNGIRFGLTRESAKLSLESILEWETENPGQGLLSLQKLPGMTPAAIDSILDWLDADDNTRPMGAESVWYQQQRKNYRPRNAVPTALEELLLIRNIDRAMIFGDDHQSAFGADPATLFFYSSTSLRMDDTFSDLFYDDRAPPSSAWNDGTFGTQHSIPTSRPASAWQFYLTPYSAEKLVNPQGVVRVYLNEPNLEFLESQLRLHRLDEESVQFILTWRRTNGQIDSPLVLLDAEIAVASETWESPFSCSDPIRYERFLRLLDEATTHAAVVLHNRINVNEAPRLVLEAVPELSPDITANILEQRRYGDAAQRHAVWLLAENIVDREMMEKLKHRLTTGGDVYRFQVAAMFDGNVVEGRKIIQRAEVVLDATVKPVRMAFYKDLTPLGFPDGTNRK